MKVAERWQRPVELDSRSNRFDIFSDYESSEVQPAIKRPKTATSIEFKAPQAPQAADLRNGPKEVYKLPTPTRRFSLPLAEKQDGRVNLPREQARETSQEKTVGSKAARQVPNTFGNSYEQSPRAITEYPHVPFSLWDYLQLELAATDSDEAHEYKRERVKNFLILPDALERTLMFGFIVCLDSFLYILTILPLRFCRSVLNLLRRTLRNKASLKSSEKVDVLKGSLIIITCLVLNQLDASRIYHNIRGQAAIKLYVLYNVLEIGDKLFCALGQDILDCLFSKSTFGRREDGTRRHLRPLAFLVLAVIYNVLHTVLLFYQVVTLNVTVNSFSNALMTLLLSNQFVEIKGSVFKKFEKEGLFQITCADMVERFQLFVMLLIIGLRNAFEMSPSSPYVAITTTLGPLITVLGSEVLVDWLKHAFITKFNHVRPTIYARFTDVLCRDYVKSGLQNSYVDQSPAISRRIGLPVLPLICLTIRSSSQIFSIFWDKDGGSSMMDSSTLHGQENGTSELSGQAKGWDSQIMMVSLYIVIGLIVYLTAMIVKLSIGISLIRFAHRRYDSMQVREAEESRLETERKRNDVYKGIVEVDSDTKKILNNKRDNLKGVETSRGLHGLERYSMISKRIW